MSIIKDVWVRCDGCGERAFPSHTAEQARKEAKGSGWIRKEGMDFCPMCVSLNRTHKRVVRHRTLKEVKDKYFPNRSLKELEGS